MRTRKKAWRSPASSSRYTFLATSPNTPPGLTTLRNSWKMQSVAFRELLAVEKKNLTKNYLFDCSDQGLFSLYVHHLARDS